MNSPDTGKCPSLVITDKKLLELECTLWEKGYTRIAGIDEAGRGPLAGPVVAAACILPCDFDLPGLQDSKKLSPGRRERLVVGIKDQAIAWSVAVVSEREIEVLNILQATLKAMVQAVNSLALRPEVLLIDGRDTLDMTKFTMDKARSVGDKVPFTTDETQGRGRLTSDDTGETLLQQAVIGGDARSASIAAASILAKVTRDHLMIQYSEIYPGYGFDKHKGYGTLKHMEALRRLGPCPLHRMSFAPVKELQRIRDNQ